MDVLVAMIKAVMELFLLNIAQNILPPVASAATAATALHTFDARSTGHCPPAHCPSDSPCWHCGH